MKVLALKASAADAEGVGGPDPEGSGHSKRAHDGTEEERGAVENSNMVQEIKKRRRAAVGAEMPVTRFAGEHSAPAQARRDQTVPRERRSDHPQHAFQAEASPSRGKVVPKFHVQSRKPLPSRQQKELKLPRVTRYPVSAWVQDTIRIASKELNTVEESFVLAASLGAARALKEKYSTCHVSNPPVTFEPSPVDVAINQVSRGTVVADKCLTNADGLKDIDGEEDDGTIDEQRYFKDEGGCELLGGDTWEGSDPLEVHASNMSLDAAVSEMRVWDESLQNTAELQQYWAEGRGFPEPFMYQPEMERRWLKRDEELRRHERVYVALEQRRADDAIKALKIPPAPEKPAVPGLYHLHTFGGSVTLPCSWDHETGDSFRRAWEERYPTRQFQDELMGCLWWWTSKKVSSDSLHAFLSSDLILL